MKNIDARVVLEKFISDFVSQFSETQVSIEKWTYQLNRKYLDKNTLLGKEKLIGDLTVQQYLELSEEEKDKLWSEWYNATLPEIRLIHVK